MSDLDDLSIPDLDSVSGSTMAGSVEAGLASSNAQCFFCESSRVGFDSLTACVLCGGCCLWMTSSGYV